MVDKVVTERNIRMDRVIDPEQIMYYVKSNDGNKKPRIL